MSLVCTRMPSVCHLYVLICQPYVLVCHPYVTRMWFYHEPQIYAFDHLHIKFSKIHQTLASNSLNKNHLFVLEKRFFKTMQALRTSLLKQALFWHG